MPGLPPCFTRRKFQLALPLRGATQVYGRHFGVYRISIRAPLAGWERPRGWSGRFSRRHFNPRSPCGERHDLDGLCRFYSDFNPRSPCGERLSGGTRSIVSWISIRAPLAGSDQVPDLHNKTLTHISIRAPLAGSDKTTLLSSVFYINFNPRSPCGERRQFPPVIPKIANFNPRSPCGERLPGAKGHGPHQVISIRAPLAGSDGSRIRTAPRTTISIRAPLAGSDGARRYSRTFGRISIRAPLAGSDARTACPLRPCSGYFNPRSPCGERPLLKRQS